MRRFAADWGYRVIVVALVAWNAWWLGRDYWPIPDIKSVEQLAPVHSKQLLTYLRLTNLRVGLLLNFGAATLKEGVHRIVNHLPPSASPRLRVNHPGR